MDFDLHIGIDYSGAQTPASRLSALQAYATTDGLPESVKLPASTTTRRRNWTRKEIADWLVDTARSGKRYIAGIDHAFSFPKRHFDRYGLTSWLEFLDDFCRH